MDKQGILTLDFITSILIILITCLTIINTANEKMETINKTETMLLSRQECEKISSTINLAISSPKTKIRLKTPEHIANSSNYKIIIKSSKVYIEINNMKAQSIIYPINNTNTIILSANTSYEISYQEKLIITTIF